MTPQVEYHYGKEQIKHENAGAAQERTVPGKVEKHEVYFSNSGNMAGDSEQCINSTVYIENR